MGMQVLRLREGLREMLTGIISVLYKGKGPREDPRSYRPVTLLNGDYKVLMRALTVRMNEAVVQFVSPASPAQYNFSDGRQRK